MNWKNGSLGRFITSNVKRRSDVVYLFQLWELFLGENNFQRPVNHEDSKRFSLISRFGEIYADLRLKGQLKNAVKFAKYLTPSEVSPEERVEFTIQNYELGRELERRFYTGSVTGPYMLTIEPHSPYNNQEGLWMLKLHDVSLPGHPNIARVGINFHVENGQIVLSIGVIQGVQSKKKKLDLFRRQVKQPWPVFMVQALQHFAGAMGAKTIRGITRDAQPFHEKGEFKSGKGKYDLYNTTFENMGFRPPIEKQNYFETAVIPLKKKRTDAFERIFPKTAM
ncbi:Uncharacterised protein [uncultured archaeon]|nr:Uncharacterised protein [uncultured archaeon]